MEKPEHPTGFIGYATTDRESASAVRTALREIGIECFLAHETLAISDDWRARIVEELGRIQIFVALLSKDFRASEWAPQELGCAFGRREVLILPLSLDDTTPFGLISHLHGLPLPETVSREFFVPALAERFPRTVIPALIALLAEAVSFREAERLMKPLIPLFDRLTDAEIDAFVTASTANGEIWNATLCRSRYLPAFIKMHRARISPEKLEALTTKIR